MMEQSWVTMRYYNYYGWVFHMVETSNAVNVYNSVTYQLHGMTNGPSIITLLFASVCIQHSS